MLPRMRIKTFFLLSFVGCYIKTGKLTQEDQDHMKNKCLAPHYLPLFEVTEFYCLAVQFTECKAAENQAQLLLKECEIKVWKVQQNQRQVSTSYYWVFSCLSGGGTFLFLVCSTKVIWQTNSCCHREENPSPHHLLDLLPSFCPCFLLT